MSVAGAGAGADGNDFVGPTTGFWQELLPPDDPAANARPPFRHAWPARLPDGRVLRLPLRRLPSGDRAVASLIANHASFPVVAALAAFMAEAAGEAGPEAIVGMPTLGLVFAPQVARRLGHANYVPLGYSRKFWYEDALSEPVRSITTPGQDKRVFLDPNLVPRVAGRRVVVVDDAVSSGTTVLSVLSLLERLGCRPLAIVVAMRQGIAWRARLAERDPDLPARVRGVFACPLFERVEGGWAPVPGTLDGR